MDFTKQSQGESLSRSVRQEEGLGGRGPSYVGFHWRLGPGSWSGLERRSCERQMQQPPDVLGVSTQ